MNNKLATLAVVVLISSVVVAVAASSLAQEDTPDPREPDQRYLEELADMTKKAMGLSCTLPDSKRWKSVADDIFLELHPGNGDTLQGTFHVCIDDVLYKVAVQGPLELGPQVLPAR